MNRSTLALASLLVAATAAPALATDCEMPTYQAYSYAVQRGWHFNCWTTGMGDGSLTPVIGASINCVKKTPPIVPPNQYLGVKFFGKGSKDRGNGQLENGWRIRSFTASPQHERKTGGTSALYARTKVTSGNKTYNFKIKTLKLTKKNGRCSDWKEAFD